MKPLVSDISTSEMLEKLDSIQSSVDSIMTGLNAPKIFEQPELLADEVTSFWIALIAMVSGILAAIFSFLGYWSQRKTMFNTDKVSMTVQKSRFRDITRHLYRNLICTLAMTDKYFMTRTEDVLSYPSEEHLLKLKFLPDDVVHLEKYLNNEVVSAKMHQFMLQARNYSTETDVAISHLKDAGISSDVTRRDLAVLAFKPALLTHFILNVEAEVDATDKHYRDEDYDYLLERTILIYMDSHIGNVRSKLGKAEAREYRYTDYLGDGSFKFHGKFNEMLDGHPTISRTFLTDHFASKDDDFYMEYMDGSIRLSKLWEMTSGQNFRSLLLSEDIDVRRLISTIMSVDVFLEMPIINIITHDDIHKH